MDAKINPAFWDDMEEHPFQMKLTVLWCMTNSSRDSCGVFRRSPARFAFETRLEPEWLASTIAHLPRMFVEDGDRVLLKNFIRYNIGTGDNLRLNNQAKALTKPFQHLSARLQCAILATYPELKPLLSPYQALSECANPLQTLADPALSPSADPSENLSLSEGLPEFRKHKLRKISTVQGVQGEPTEGDPTLEEVLTRAQMLGVSEADARAFFNHYDGLGWMNGHTHITRWWSWLPRWKARAQELAQKNAALPYTASAAELRTIDEALESETDPNMRSELKRRRVALGGEK